MDDIITTINTEFNSFIDHNLTVNQNDVVYLIEEYNNDKTKNLKIFNSETYLIADKFVINNNENYISLKFSFDIFDKIIIKLNDNNEFIYNKIKYIFQLYNKKLVMIPKDYFTGDRYEQKLSAYMDIYFSYHNYKPLPTNENLKLLYYQYLDKIEKGDIYNDDDEAIIIFEDILNVFLVYNNCREFAFINSIDMDYDLKLIINQLGLYIIPNYGSDECFITKHNIEHKKYNYEIIGKMLGYVSYKYQDWQEKVDRKIVSLDYNLEGKIMRVYSEIVKLKYYQNIKNDLHQKYLNMSLISQMIFNYYDIDITFSYDIKDFKLD